jgi:hypothetical protein
MIDRYVLSYLIIWIKRIKYLYLIICRNISYIIFGSINYIDMCNDVRYTLCKLYNISVWKWDHLIHKYGTKQSLLYNKYCNR